MRSYGPENGHALKKHRATGTKLRLILLAAGLMILGCGGQIQQRVIRIPTAPTLESIVRTPEGMCMDSQDAKELRLYILELEGLVRGP